MQTIFQNIDIQIQLRFDKYSFLLKFRTLIRSHRNLKNSWIPIWDSVMELREESLFWELIIY